MIMTIDLLYMLNSINFSDSDKALIISGLLPAIATIIGFVITIVAWKNNVKVRRAD